MDKIDPQVGEYPAASILRVVTEKDRNKKLIPYRREPEPVPPRAGRR